MSANHTRKAIFSNTNRFIVLFIKEARVMGGGNKLVCTPEDIYT